MSLYGALFGGVSGLRAQSSRIGIISDNIANVNTVGYKQGTATFKSLVVNADSAVSYQTGGVRAGTAMNVSKQGLLQSTESPTDIALSGGGFFVVKSTADSTVASAPLYTRAGSFTQDSLGNFVNSQGFYLQGWPLDREGRLPGEAGNLNTTSFTNFDSLETVNVESASGVAQSTSTISLGANLKSGETVYPGEAGTFALDANNAQNSSIQSSAIIVSSEYFSGADADSTMRGDSFTLQTGNGLSYTYEYGGYTVGRKVTTSSSNTGDGNVDNQAALSLAQATAVTYVSGNTFRVTIPNHGLLTGDTVTFAGMSAIGSGPAVPASEFNASHTITRIDANTLQFTTSTTPGSVASIPAATFTADTRQFMGAILDADTTTGVFLNSTGASTFTSAAKTFTITNEGAGGTVTFTYTNSSPNTLSGQFNNLTTLAAAIDSTTGLTARVVDGRLVVGAEDATQSVTFGNGDDVGTSSQRGIDWVTELDLQDISARQLRFSNLDGLAALVNASAGVSASVANPLSNPVLSINVDDPLDTIQFTDLGPATTANTSNATPITLTAGSYSAGSDITVTIDMGAGHGITSGQYVYLAGLGGTGSLPGNLPNGGPYQVTVTGNDISFTVTAPTDLTLAGGTFAAASGHKISVLGTTNHGSLLAHLGIENTGVSSLNGTAYTAAQDTGVLGPQYDPTGAVGQNMASGDLTAQFSRNVRIYDGLGSGHDVRFSFIKTASNTWAAEVHVIPPEDVTTSLVDGQIATGTIIFNGDGTLRSVSSGLTDPVDITWTNGAIASQVTFDLGTAGQPFGTANATTIGLSDGLSQFDSAYNVNFANQNGAPVGQLESVSIDTEGYIIASYSNGETQSLYKLPIAEYPNPNGLRAVSGNVYAQTRDSGEVNLREAGTNGVGTVVSAALEQSNVDLAEQLTEMIVAQRSYQANTKVIKTADELLDQLNQI